MEWLQIAVLGVVQGVTEFLPISSSAHLILVPKLVQWPDQGVVFDVALHVGTLLAVMIYFRKDVMEIARGKWDFVRGRFETAGARLVVNLLISTLPLIAFGFLLKDFVSGAGRSVAVLGTTSILFAVVLWWADRKTVRAEKSVEKMSRFDALVFGIFQAVAIIPGTSRSGICMTAGRFMGYDRTAASRYAMLMAMPVIALLGAYTVISDMDSAINWHDNAAELLGGIAFSAVSALVAIHGLMYLVARMSFLPFVIYRIVLGVVLWIVVLGGL